MQWKIYVQSGRHIYSGAYASNVKCIVYDKHMAETWKIKVAFLKGSHFCVLVVVIIVVVIVGRAC